MYGAYYKCRLCGQVYQVGGTTDKKTADLCMIELTCDIRGTVPMAPTITDVHDCSGEYAGSIGLADFIGWRKEEDA